MAKNENVNSVGLVSPVVSAVLNLEEAVKAVQMSMQGHICGKIVIKVV